MEFNLEITHVCGHVQMHAGETASGDDTWLRAHLAKEKCRDCRPTCRFCHRHGDRENMRVTEQGIYCNTWCEEQSANQTCYSEHNNIVIPARLRNWRDDSWHNDLCARSAYALPNGDEIVIWVDCENPEEREDVSLSRFIVTFAPQGEITVDIDPLYDGNDEAQMGLWAHAAEIVACGPDEDDDPTVGDKVAMIRALMKGGK